MTATKMLDGPPLELLPDRAWMCSVCKHAGPWTNEHSWFGSYLDLEGGRSGRAKTSIVVTCSAGCREIAAVQGLVPDDAEVLG